MPTLIDEISQKDFENWKDDGNVNAGPDIVGITEIANMFKVSKQAVDNWRKRYEDFPEPYVILAAGAIYHRSKIKAWAKKHGMKVPK